MEAVSYFRWHVSLCCGCFFFFQAEDGIRDYKVTGVQTCALPICLAVSVASGAATQSISNGRRNGNRQAADRPDRGLRREAFHHRKDLGRRGAQGDRKSVV